MSNNDDVIIFKGKSLASLMQDIYKNSMRKTTIIEGAIAELKKHIDSKEDIVYIGPIIADYMDVALKNDDSLIKLATIVQRLVSADKRAVDGGGLELSEAERSDLLKGVSDEMKSLEKSIAEATIPKLPDLDKKKK